MAQYSRKKICWFAYLSVLICWSILAYYELENIYHQGQLFACKLDNRPYVSDFVVIYAGSLVAARAAQDKLAIYDISLQTNLVKSLIAPVSPEMPFLLQYPPHFYALLRPLAQLSMIDAWCLWGVMSLLLVAVAMTLLVRSYVPGRFSRWLAFAAAISASPTWLCVKAGQTSPLVLLGIVSFWLLMKSGRTFLAGLAAGTLLLFKLQYAPAPILIGLLLGRLRFAAGLGLSLALLAAGTTAAVGWPNVMSYLSGPPITELNTAIAGVDATFMQNLRGQMALLFDTDNETIRVISLALMFLATVSVVVMWALPRFAKTRSENFELLASITTLASLVASFHTHTQDYLIVAAPSVWLWWHCVNKVKKPKGEIDYSKPQNLPYAASSYLIMAVLAFPALSWVFFVTMPLLLMIRLEPYLLWALSVLAAALVLLFTNPDQNEGNSTDQSQAS